MPGVFRAGARPAAATCLLACLLAACSGPATDAAAPAQTDEAKPLRSLGCLPTSLVSLELPLREGFAYAHGAPRSDAHVGRCVLSMFGPRTLKSPLAFDRAYRRVFAYHEEDGTTDLRGLAPEGLQLFRIGSTSAADVWLLRADTGTELEPAHHDVLFSTRRDDGVLVDHLLVGAMALLYRRDYDIENTQAFAIREDTGRGAEAGPGYRARYRGGDDGVFALVDGQVLPPDAPPPGV